MMACVSPRAGVEQTVSVEVSNNGADVTSSGVQFVYERAPTVTGVGVLERDQGLGGDLVLRVTGKHFVQSPQLRCRLGKGVGMDAARSDAQYVGSSEVHCRVDQGRGRGRLAVEVSNNGQDFSTNGIGYQAEALKVPDAVDRMPEVSVEGMRPSFGRLTGGTCLLYTSPSPRDLSTSRMPSSA